METMSDWVAHIIDNHADWSEAARIQAALAIVEAPHREEVASEIWSVEEAERFGLADKLKDWLEDEIDDMPVDEPRDALIATLARRSFEGIDWHNLADWYLTKERENAS